MIPPTPTHLPPGTPMIAIPDSYSLWASTDAAIHFWNWVGVGQVVVQAFILLIIVYLGIRTVMNFINQFTQEDASE